MLSDAQMDAIKAEEIYRAEVRRSLDTQRPRRTALQLVFGFLSTSLGLWFLSTVVIGLATWSYGQRTAELQQEAKRQDAIRRLDVEITYRLTGFRNLHQAIGVEKAVELLERPDDSQTPQYMFPENEKRPLTALLWELHELVPGVDRPVVLKAFETARKFSSVRAYSAQKPSGSLNTLRDATQKMMLRATLPLQMKEDFNLGRWGRQFDRNAAADAIIGGLVKYDTINNAAAADDKTDSDGSAGTAHPEK